MVHRNTAGALAYHSPRNMFCIPSFEKTCILEQRIARSNSSRMEAKIVKCEVVHAKLPFVPTASVRPRLDHRCAASFQKAQRAPCGDEGNKLTVISAGSAAEKLASSRELAWRTRTLTGAAARAAPVGVGSKLSLVLTLKAAMLMMVSPPTASSTAAGTETDMPRSGTVTLTGPPAAISAAHTLCTTTVTTRVWSVSMVAFSWTSLRARASSNSRAMARSVGPLSVAGSVQLKTVLVVAVQVVAVAVRVAVVVDVERLMVCVVVEVVVETVVVEVVVMVGVVVVVVVVVIGVKE
mmetsp:Transcript_93838/g.265445  ORF Transcript_93838/g.265445 Transcript_93838/m.265445 type:complete len:294 (+) Transcript_93838:1741-2622(+)